MPRLNWLYQDPFTSRIDDLRFALKAPILGWVEASRGTRYEKYLDVIMTTPSARAYSSIIKKASLLWIAKTMEGGAGVDAYFQMLFNIVSQGIRSDAELYPALAEFIVTLAVILATFASISLFPLGPFAILIMGLIGFLAWFMRPKDHWLTFDRLDVIGIITGIGLGLLVGLASSWLLSVPVGFLAYGIFKVPSLIDDFEYASSVGLRVLTSFNELLTRPVPTPLRDFSPIEFGLKPLWLDAKNAGAPKFVSWANTLVGLYITTLNEVNRTLLAYSLVLIGIGIGVTIYLPYFVFSQIISTAGIEAIRLMAQYGGFLISGMPRQAYWTSIGIGLASGFSLFDHRTGVILAGLMGVLAWFLLHPFFLI